MSILYCLSSIVISRDRGSTARQRHLCIYTETVDRNNYISIFRPAGGGGKKCPPSISAAAADQRLARKLKSSKAAVAHFTVPLARAVHQTHRHFVNQCRATRPSSSRRRLFVAQRPPLGNCCYSPKALVRRKHTVWSLTHSSSAEPATDQRKL